MTLKSPTTTAGLAVERNTKPVSSDRFASQDGQSPRMRPLMRRYEIAHLTTLSHVEEISCLAPASAAFEDCFAALGRGAIVQTDSGPRAVEDLWPGDRILTASHGMQILQWRGMVQIVPGSQSTRREMATMTRLTADALGWSRPTSDLVLGPSARLAHRAPGTSRLTGDDVAFVPVRDFIDQSQVIELTPVAPVHAYQLGFADHCSLMVNGVELESLHPGLPHRLNMQSNMATLLMSLFPHKATLADFGPLLHPRIALRDLDLFAVA